MAITNPISELEDENGNILGIAAKGLDTPVQISLTGNVTGDSGNTDLSGNVTIPTTITNGSVTESKIATDAVTNGKVKDGELTKAKLNASAYNEVDGTIADGTNANLATKTQVKAYVESVLSSEGHYKGVQSVATINTYPVHLIANIYSEGTTFEANKHYSLTLHIYSAGGGTEEGILKIGYTSGASSTDNGELSAAWLCRSEDLPVDVVRVGVVRSSTGIGLFVLFIVPHANYYLSYTPISKSKYGTWNLYSTDGPKFQSMTDAETQLASVFDATKTAFDESTYSMDNSFVDATTYDVCAHQIGVQLQYYANVRLPTNILCNEPSSASLLKFLCLSQFTQSKSYRFELRFPMANNVFLYNNLGFEVTVFYPSYLGGNVEVALPDGESYTMNKGTNREKCCSAWATLIGSNLYVSFGY